jgi:hypothetical protein
VRLFLIPVVASSAAAAAIAWHQSLANGIFFTLYGLALCGVLWGVARSSRG